MASATLRAAPGITGPLPAEPSCPERAVHGGSQLYHLFAPQQQTRADGERGRARSPAKVRPTMAACAFSAAQQPGPPRALSSGVVVEPALSWVSRIAPLILVLGLHAPLPVALARRCCDRFMASPGAAVPVACHRGWAGTRRRAQEDSVAAAGDGDSPGRTPASPPRSSEEDPAG